MSRITENIARTFSLDTTLEQIKLRVVVARLTELGSEWRTENMFPAYRIIPYNRLFFPLEGEGTVEHEGRCYRLKRGKMLLIPAFAQVKVACEHRLVKYWSHFNMFILDRDLDLFALNGNCLELDITEEQIPACCDWFRRLKATYDLDGSNSLSSLQHFEAEGALRLLLSPFLRQWSERSSQHEFPRLIELISYIEKNLIRELTLSGLGRQAGLHPNYLSVLFRRQMGLPPIAYLNRRRMERAVYLLRTTDLTIGEITALIGVSNVQVFSKMFKKYTGQAPSIFKQQVQSALHRQ